MDELEEIVDEPTREHASLPNNESVDIEIDDRFEEDEDEEYYEEESPLVAKIKAQLPFLSKIIDKIPKKKKDTVKEDKTRTEVFVGDDVEEKNGIVDKIKTQLPFLTGILDKLPLKKSKKLNVEDNDFDPDEVSPIKYAEDEDEEKPKRKITPIHIIFILVVAYVGYDYMMNPEGDSIEQTKTAEKKPIRKKPIKKSPPTEEPSDKVAPTPEPKVKAVDETVKPKPQETSTEESLDDLFAEDKPVVKEETKVDEAPPVVDSTEPQDDSTVEIEEPTPIETSDTTIEAPSDQAEDEPSSDVSNNEEPSISESEDEDSSNSGENTVDTIDPNLLKTDSIVDDISAPAQTTDITEAILKDLEVKVNERAEKADLVKATKPVDAPEYEMVGRGLVYNCKGKHWACIDSVSFETCQKNYSWNAQKGRTIECYPLDSYDTIDDCATIQQFKIDNVTETKFCN